MPPYRVVEALDVFKDREPCFSSCLVMRVIDPFGLERVEETLCHRVVETVPGSAHAAPRPVFIKNILVLRGSVLATSVRVMNETRFEVALLDRHL